MNLRKLFRRKVILYGGNDAENELEAYCSECRLYHSLPRGEWVMLKPLFGSMRLACVESVRDEIEEGWDEVPDSVEHN